MTIAPKLQPLPSTDECSAEPDDTTRIASLPAECPVPAGALVLARCLGFAPHNHLRVGYRIGGRDHVRNAPLLHALPEAERAQYAGRALVLNFLGGDPSRPLVAGYLNQDSDSAQMASLPAAVSLAAEDCVELSCGAASIRLNGDGSIAINGETIVARASGGHRILGGSVHIN